jgi:hypothetical protein
MLRRDSDAHLHPADPDAGSPDAHHHLRDTGADPNPGPDRCADRDAGEFAHGRLLDRRQPVCGWARSRERMLRKGHESALVGGGGEHDAVHGLLRRRVQALVLQQRKQYVSPDGNSHGHV